MQKLKNEELNRLSLEEFKKAEKKPLIIVLDNVRSLHNVGSVFRTADAFLVKKIYLCGITGTPPNKEIYKTALGATDSLDWEYRKSTYDCVLELKQKGYTIAAVEQAVAVRKVLGRHRPVLWFERHGCPGREHRQAVEALPGQVFGRCRHRTGG